MLGSITPLGERGRGSRWWVTFAWFVVGCVTGGALVGAVLGSVGAALFDALDLGAHHRSQILVAATGLAIAADAAGRRVSTTTRQVNAYWIGRYKGWVVGLGFGFQLGAGVATIVTTGLVYVALLAAALSGSMLGGIVVMAAFGLARGIALLPAATITTPSGLYLADAWLTRRAGTARFLAVAVAAAVAVPLLLATL